MGLPSLLSFEHPCNRCGINISESPPSFFTVSRRHGTENRVIIHSAQHTCLCFYCTVFTTAVRMLVLMSKWKPELTEYPRSYLDNRTPQGSHSDTCQSCCWYLSLSRYYASGMYLRMRSDSTALITFQVGWWGTFPLHTIHPFPYLHPTPCPIPLHSCANRKYKCP